MSEQHSVAQFDHFIPISTSELVEALQQDENLVLSAEQKAVMHKLRQILSFQFYRQLVELKRIYQPLNPDSDLITATNTAEDAESCIQRLRDLLVAANYTELDQQQIEYALMKTSPYGLEIGIDFDAFAHASLFYRGKSQHSVQVRDWKKFYLKKTTISMIRYQRIFLLLQFHPGSSKPGLHLKLFRDILRPDLEMLFPDSKVRMKAFDKLKLAITGGGGTAGGLFATVGKVTAAVNPWTIFIAVAGFAALLWRQISKIFIQRTRYMATLAQNLYFHNLDNNAGAITFLIDQARQEEIKETLLAYALLCQQESYTRAALDSACEDWFQQQFDRPIDFDISDALRKLEEFGALSQNDDTLTPVDPQPLLAALDRAWQSFIEPGG